MKTQTLLKIAIAILILLITIAATWSIAVSKMEAKTAAEQARLKREMEIYNNGTSYGYQAAIVEVMQGVSTCQPLSVHAQNTTLTLIAAECLEQQAEE